MTVLSNQLNQRSTTPDKNQMDSNLNIHDKSSALNKDTSDIKDLNHGTSDKFFHIKDDSTVKEADEQSKTFQGLVNVELSADIKRDLYQK